MRQKLRAGFPAESQADLQFLKDVIEAGKVTPVIDRTYPLSDASEAIGYIAEGHACGKVVVTS